MDPNQNVPPQAPPVSTPINDPLIVVPFLDVNQSPSGSLSPIQSLPQVPLPPIQPLPQMQTSQSPIYPEPVFSQPISLNQMQATEMQPPQADYQNSTIGDSLSSASSQGNSHGLRNTLIGLILFLVIGASVGGAYYYITYIQNSSVVPLGNVNDQVAPVPEARQAASIPDVSIETSSSLEEQEANAIDIASPNDDISSIEQESQKL